MAQKITVRHTCDEEHGGGEVEAVDTIAFTDPAGDSYEKDVCTEHKKAAEEMFGLLRENARRSLGRQDSPPRRRSPQRTAGSRARSGEIRVWARRNGLEVSDRGRIPAGIVAQFEAEQD